MPRPNLALDLHFICFSHLVVSASLRTHGLACWSLSLGFSRQEYWSGVAISFSRTKPDLENEKERWKSLSRVQLFVTP